jgi:hypothetical protein
MSFDLTSHLVHQAAWSELTFGPARGGLGCVNHIAKEVVEVRAKPDDLEEWIDIVILAFDGLWRTDDRTPAVLAAVYGDFPHLALPLDGSTPEKMLKEIEYLLNLLRGTVHLPLAWMQIIDRAIDGACLMGFTHQQIVEALVAKQLKNEGRTWPDWRGFAADQSIEHVRELV